MKDEVVHILLILTGYDHIFHIYANYVHTRGIREVRNGGPPHSSNATPQFHVGSTEPSWMIAMVNIVLGDQSILQ